jgi:hypothetical protein
MAYYLNYIPKNMSRYKVEEKLHLGEQKRLNTTASELHLG